MEFAWRLLTRTITSPGRRPAFAAGVPCGTDWTSTPLATGSSSGGGTFYVGYGTQAPWFVGALDEVAYYDSALSPERVLQHFLADPPPATQSAPRCRVPDLRGGRLASARTELTRAGCSLGAVTRRHVSAPAKPGTVIAQSVPAGRSTSSGRAVRITIAR